MTKPVLFFAQTCPDTAPFVAELQALNVEYQAVEVLENLVNFKRFLKLRDNHPAFNNAKTNGYIGIPALVLADDGVILDISTLQTEFGKS
ncbi:hypothetical protein A1D23_11365 [Chelonobacter oris]|uniref:Glutaredoxin-related protein n=1 Tax=Chelonobacter oris TaxID=505317 RepID=A0A0A3AWB5_9PAST|nr:hypothetical protein [Chelonobacter oris]KGQ71395.1 hypothetical protein OA57_00970 [Chelonobacter oris]MDH3001050.1 hypothetical protein [Chelonobacter oris]